MGASNRSCSPSVTCASGEECVVLWLDATLVILDLPSSFCDGTGGSAGGGIVPTCGWQMGLIIPSENRTPKATIWLGVFFRIILGKIGME